MREYSRQARLRLLALGAILVLVGGASGCSLVGGGGTTPPPPQAGLLEADVTILSDPVGGGGASSLSCTFQVSALASEGTGSVLVNARWVAPCGTHKSETFSFGGGDATFTTTYSDAGGYPITKTFWVEITWQDARGGHQVRSASAVPGA